MSFQPARLEVEPGLLDAGLRLLPEPDDPLSALLPAAAAGGSKVQELDTLLPAPDYPSVTVVPKPGLCVKTKNRAGDKFFLNLCRLDEVPPPPPMEEQELQRMIASEDYSNLWRVPMSLGQPRKEKDKSGSECWATEVALNTAWFDTAMKESEIFTGFVITVAMEGLGDKYGEDATLDRDTWTVLKNKKAMGDKLPAHRIQQRASAGIQQVAPGQRAPARPAVQRAKPEAPVRAKEAAVGAREVEPKYRVEGEPDGRRPVQLRLTVELPGVRGGREVVLDVGEDRVLVCATRQNYLLDIFLPFNLKSEAVTAKFVKDEQKLEVILPVVK